MNFICKKCGEKFHTLPKGHGNVFMRVYPNKRKPDEPCDGEIVPIFDPMNEPTECPLCNDFPSWDEISDGAFECRNCGAVISLSGQIIEEPDIDEEEE